VPEPRKGSVRIADIPPAVLARLNAGELETATLAESLALDFATLLAAAVPDVPPAAVFRVREAAGTLGVVKRMELVGGVLLDHLGLAKLPRAAEHPADTVRGWACYVVGRAPGLPLAERLRLIRPLAADPHFGVREWAWMAVRPHLAADISAAVRELTPWTADPAPAVRRFAVESTRPRGVWCGHIAALKDDPEIGLPLLDPLRVDPAKYVQDSVANWLNDAGKSRPDWVRAVCERWRKSSPGAETARICRRAERSL
jgi:3-methyladenine DNA glycosylase AlkC